MADPETVTLKDAVKRRGPYAVWDLLTEDEQLEAAGALWENAEADARAAIEMALAKELKFRPQSVGRLSTDRVAPRLARMADTLPEMVLFQFLFHLHMAHRRDLLARFLDAVGLPNKDGVLDLPEDAGPPEAPAVDKAAAELIEEDRHQALVYLATLRVADKEFWQAVDPTLAAHDEAGEPLQETSKSKKKAAKPAEEE